MTTEISTTQAPAATLDASELFAEFYDSDLIEYDTRGKERYRFAVEALLSPSDDYCEFDYKIIPGEVDDPSEMFEQVENELLGALANLRLARNGWEDIRRERLIDEESAVERFTIAPVAA